MPDQAKILLIEDDEVDQTSVVRALKGAFTVVLAETEEAALGHVQNGEFYCAILDFYLPATDTKTILNACLAVKLPVLMLGGYNPSLIANLAAEFGATNFLSKDELNAQNLLKGIETTVERSKALENIRQSARLRQLKILLVDDDEVDILSVKRAFRRVNISNPIITASNGCEALDILRGRDGNTTLEFPYIILLDLNMPIMNGLQFLDELRSDPELKNTLVFVLTSSEDETEKKQTFEKGVLAHLIKSQAGDQFLSEIKKVQDFLISIELSVSMG